MVINEIYSMLSNCYVFNLYDFGDNGGGFVVLLDINNEVIYFLSGNYGFGEFVNFLIEGFLGIEMNILEEVVIYFNLVKIIVIVVNVENVNVIIYDVLGKIVVF